MATAKLNETLGNEPTVQYTLSPMPPDAKGHITYGAHAIVKSCGLRAIADQMKREGSKYAQGEILAIAEQMIDVIINRLQNGYSVNFGSMMRFRPSIKGRFETKDAPFDPAQHELLVAVSVGRRLRKALEGVSVEQVADQTIPELNSVEVSCSSGTRFFKVNGYHLNRSDAKWFIKVGKKTYWLDPVSQKKTGREVLLFQPEKTLSAGTEATLGLRVTTAAGTQDYFYHTPIIL